jgi:FkbM family methyltransferase
MSSSVERRTYNTIISRIRTTFSFLEHPSSIKALVTWPRFSITSFNMISSLAKQGVLPLTVIDVGANVGQFAIAVATLWLDAQVHAFEPVPACIERLRKNVSRLGNITVYPLALGDREGELLLRVNSYSHASSALTLSRAHRDAFPKAREVKTVPVKVSTLDQVFADVELRLPALLKVDVQGFEPHTLRGAKETLKRVDYAVLEVSFKPMYEGEVLFMDIVRMMEKQGLHFERPVGWLAAPESGEILQMDALFTRAT